MVDTDLSRAYAGTDSYDMLLFELAAYPSLVPIALHWRAERSGMGEVRPFDGKDSTTEGVYFLLESMLRIVKVRVELSALEGTASTVDLVLAMSSLNSALSSSILMLCSLFDAHAHVHGVGLAAPRDAGSAAAGEAPPGRRAPRRGSARVGRRDG